MHLECKIMHDARSFILETLSSYKELLSSSSFYFLPSETNRQQCEYAERMQRFIEQEPLCFHRECPKGHVTGSAFVLNADFSKILLNHHLKLNKWLQLGGHADGDFLISRVALREAQEESGLEDLYFLDFSNSGKGNIESKSLESISKQIPFDIDIHLIPERTAGPKKEAAHLHYDFRYILYTHDNNFCVSDESIDLKWVPLTDVGLYTNESSTLRPIEKIKYFVRHCARPQTNFQNNEGIEKQC